MCMQILSQHHCLSHCVNGHLARGMRAFGYLRTHTEFYNVYCKYYDTLFKDIMDIRLRCFGAAVYTKDK